MKDELYNQGIDLPCTWAVVNKSSKDPRVLYCNSSEDRQAILTSGFNARLFPTDVLDGKNTLHLHFPTQNSFIVKKMWAVLFSSAVFISLIIYCFGFAIAVILRQKKTSDITNDFISNMTHELKTPISTVSIACEALLDPDIRALPNQSDRYLNVIKDENSRLAQQVEKVLQIARLDKGSFKLKITRVDVHQVIDKVLKNLGIQIEKREGAIRKELYATDFVVEADEVHLSNIIHNLIDNANKYSPEKPEISITTQNVENGLQICITDKGQGIAKNTLNKIFEKFYRVPTGNVHDVKGFGLGLSYVKKMIEAHGGQISVKSELGKGSIFTLYFPFRYEQNKDITG